MPSIPDPAPATEDSPLSTRLAGAYLTVVAVLWLTHVVLLVLGLTTGRTSWTTENPWISIPGGVGILLAIAVVLVVDRRLPAKRREPTSGVFRWFCLAYGSAVPEAWRRLRR